MRLVQHNPCQPHFLIWSSGSVHRKQIVFAANSTMAEGQIKSKGQKLAVCCHHTAYEWDHHHFCVSCREKNKGDDVCVTSKEEDCFVCLQFTAEQRKKLKAKKAYERRKFPKKQSQKRLKIPC